MQCVNNLKQIGLAMHNYLSANNTFPMGGTPQMDPTGSYPTVTGPWEWENYSSFAMMLPYLEQQTVFNACNLMICPDTGGGVPQPWNSTVYYTKLNAFLCPSDPYSGIQDLCNYAGCFGTTTWMPYDQVNSTIPNNGHADTTGIFTIWKSYGIQSVTDGTSNTMAFAEQLVGYGASGYQRYAAYGGSPMYRGNLVFTPSSFVVQSGRVYDISAIPNALSLVQADIQSCASFLLNYQTQLTSPNKVVDYRGWKWILGIPGSTMFNSVQTPNESIFNGCRPGPGSYSGSVGNNTDESWSVPATSSHPGGVNVTMADGHVGSSRTVSASPPGGHFPPRRTAK